MCPGFDARSNRHSLAERRGRGVHRGFAAVVHVLLLLGWTPMAGAAGVADPAPGLEDEARAADDAAIAPPDARDGRHHALAYAAAGLVGAGALALYVMASRRRSGVGRT